MCLQVDHLGQFLDWLSLQVWQVGDSEQFLAPIFSPDCIRRLLSLLLRLRLLGLVLRWSFGIRVGILEMSSWT